MKEVAGRKSCFSKELAGIVLDELPEFNEVNNTIKRWVKSLPHLRSFKKGKHDRFD